LAIMLAISCVAADGAAGDRPAAAGDAAASEVGLVTADRAVGNQSHQRGCCSRRCW
jgi:hypothetical protein